MFEYDPYKAKLNLEKHKVSFETAMEVFDDPYRLCVDVSKIEQNESREMTIGTVGGQEIILAVVHTDRSGIIRLISARKAQPREKREYEEHKKKIRTNPLVFSNT